MTAGPWLRLACMELRQIAYDPARIGICREKRTSRRAEATRIMVTLKDIGRHLGISPAQVSRALGGYSDVSERTRQRVEEAVHLLGYHPNPNARKLRLGRSGIVGLVVPERSEQEESNILLEILLGLAVEFWKRNVLVVLNVMPESGSSQESYQRLFRQGAVDGFVVVNPSADPGGLSLLTREGIPFVTHGRAGAEDTQPFVDLDNRAVGCMMAQRLTELGHRDIAFIDGPENSFSAQERLEGLVAILAGQKQTLRNEFICRNVMTEQFGEAAVRRLFADGAPRPTAIMVGNMVLATGVMRALAAHGLSIPGDVSVMAHDDGLARYPRSALLPELSGTASPFAEAWEDIAGFLEAAISAQGSAADTGNDKLQKLIAPIEVQGASIARAAGLD